MLSESEMMRDDAFLHIAYSGLSDLVREAAKRVELEDLLKLTDENKSPFETRRALAEAIGIGPSTVAGWVKEGKLPPLARAVVGLIHVAGKFLEIVLEDEFGRDELGDMIVRDGDGFMIVNFPGSGRGGYGQAPVIGEIVARDIRDMKTAQRFISHRDLRAALKLAIEDLEHWAETGNSKFANFDGFLSYLEGVAELENADGRRELEVSVADQEANGSTERDVPEHPDSEEEHNA